MVGVDRYVDDFEGPDNIFDLVADVFEGQRSKQFVMRSGQVQPGAVNPLGFCEFPYQRAGFGHQNVVNVALAIGINTAMANSFEVLIDARDM